ncbi:MAG TPA: hypothetical protein VIR58_03805, partial [Acidimicrobiales bacterium]
YGSTAVILLGPVVLLLAVGVGIGLVLFERSVRSDASHRPEVTARVAASWWSATLAAAVLLGGLALLLPRAL